MKTPYVIGKSPPPKPMPTTPLPDLQQTTRIVPPAQLQRDGVRFGKMQVTNGKK